MEVASLGTTSTLWEEWSRGKSSGTVSYEVTDPSFTSPTGRETCPDAEVGSRENSSKDLALTALNLSNANLPLRPGYGIAGRPIILKTNYFNIEIDVSKKLYRYNVEVVTNRKPRKTASAAGSRSGEPTLEVPGPRVRRTAFALLFETAEFQALGAGLATDYVANVITSKTLDLGAGGKKAFRIEYREAEVKRPLYQPAIFTFTLSWAGIVPATELLQYLASTTASPYDCPEKKDDAIQALNIIVAKTPNLDVNVFQAGRNKFFQYPTNTADYIDLSGGLIAVRGYYSSVRTSTMRVLLNLNAQCSPFYPAINMGRLMEQHSSWNERLWEALESFIEKLRVKTQYLKNSDGTADIRVKTVVGLSHVFEERMHPKAKSVQTYGNARGNHGNSSK